MKMHEQRRVSGKGFGVLVKASNGRVWGMGTFSGDDPAEVAWPQLESFTHLVVKKMFSMDEHRAFCHSSSLRTPDVMPSAARRRCRRVAELERHGRHERRNGRFHRLAKSI